MALITLTRVFALVTTALPSWLDDNFNAILAQVNGNLDQANVKMSADSLKVGGLQVSVTPAASKLLPLNSSAEFPFSVMPFRGCAVQKNAVQSVNSGAATALAFAGVDLYDTDSIHDPAVNNTRLTVPTGVTQIRIAAQCAWDLNTSGHRSIYVRKNGGTTMGEPLYLLPITSGYCNMTIETPVIYTAAGEYFEIVVLQNSGIALNIAATAVASMECIA